MIFNCSFYVLETSAPWNKCPSKSFSFNEAKTEARATTELGIRLINGRPCMVFACDDALVRAVPMAAADSQLNRGRAR